MSKEFNKQIMIDNIYFLLKKSGKKIGELELEAGVSPGYISRTSKDISAKPGIDFIAKVADCLNISIDTLLNFDLSSITPTENYLICFVDKLSHDTLTFAVDWNRFQTKKLDAQTPYNIIIPLFSYETFFNEFFEQRVTELVFISDSFDYNTLVCDDCFSLRLKNNNTLYVMSVQKRFSHEDDSNPFAIELWMHNSSTGKQFLCSNRTPSPLATSINNLYFTLKETMRHPKINQDLRYVIDAFMENDIKDDPDYFELPF